MRDGTAGEIVEKILSETKPEAAYFTEYEGQRGAILVVDVKDPSDIPSFSEPWFLHFNADVETDELRPEAVLQFQRLVAEAHGVLVVTPEYNWSIPGVLKNALDWGSRGPLTPFKGKPMGMMSASTGAVGGARAQGALRDVVASIGGHHYPVKGVTLGNARDRLDADGNLGDDDLDFLRGYVEGFVTFVRRLAA